MADEIIRLDYSAEDIGDNIDEVRAARGTFDTLDDRLDNIEGGGPSPSNPIASNCVSPMTGYSKSSSSTPGNISTDDTLNAAIGKLEKRTELNENNILLLEQMNGERNLFNYNAWKSVDVYNGTKELVSEGIKLTATGNNCYTYCFSSGGLEYPTEARIPVTAGETYVLLWDYTANSSQTNDLVYIFGNGEASIQSYTSAQTERLGYTIPSGVTYLTIRFGVATSGNIATYKNIMLIKRSVYDAGFTDYQPYTISNTGLTETLFNSSNLPYSPNAYVTTNGNVGDTISLTTTSNESWCYSILTDLPAGTLLKVKGTGGTNPRLWAFADANLKLLSVAQAETTTGNDFIYLTVPQNTKYTIINSRYANPYALQLAGVNESLNRLTTEVAHLTPIKLAELSADGTAEFAATQYKSICMILTNTSNYKTSATTLPAIFFEYGFKICADVDSAQGTAIKGTGNTYTVTVPSGHKVYIYGY